MVPKMTSAGYGLMIRALTKEGIQFSKLKFGNGSKSEDYALLNDLQNPIMSVDLTEITRMEQYVLLEGTVTNARIDSGFDWTEMGVFATNPDGGDDILYAYAHCEFEPEEKPIPIPANTSGILELTHRVYVYVGEIDNVTAILAQSAEYATKAALDSHQKDNQNPHKVTKDQVGLGNVPNVTPENQVPAFNNTIGEIKTDDDGKTTFENVANGDTMGTILNKIRTAISAVLSHVNGKNPHRLDAKAVNAADRTHYHSANDLNSGILGIKRGGTGAENASDARTSLGIQCGVTTEVIGDELESDKETATFVNVKFPKRFGTIPVVTVTLVDTVNAGNKNCDHIISVENVTQEGFTVWIYHKSTFQKAQFNWIAIG